MKHFVHFLFIVFTFFGSVHLYSQPCNLLNLQFRSDMPSVCAQSTMTMIEDKLDRRYLYVAQKEGGLIVYNVMDVSSPVKIATINVQSLQNLDVMNLEQKGTMLYLALGNHFSDNQKTGMAAVSIENPDIPLVTSVWTFPENGGGGIVTIEDAYVYLGGMGNGLFVFDVSDKQKPILVSRYLPDINYPVPSTDSAKFNVRGMAVRNSIVYLCYDAGGLRIIDCSNKKDPKEIGRYSNPVLNNKPRAYNNIAIDDTLAFVTVDYCGVEVLNIKRPSNITLHSWWNPWICHTNPLNWFSSNGHANEIQYNRECKKLFISTGKSDMYVVDISDPAHPDSCFIYGGINNNIGTWGVHVRGNRIYLSYICTLGIPFASNWSGVKLLTYVPCSTNAVEEQPKPHYDINPNPVSGMLYVTANTPNNTTPIITMYNILGNPTSIQCIKQSENLFASDISNLAAGVYVVTITYGRNMQTSIVLVQ